MRRHIVAGAAEPATGRGAGRLVQAPAAFVPHLDAHSHTKFGVSTLLADHVIEQAASFPLLALGRHRRLANVRFAPGAVVVGKRVYTRAVFKQ